MSRNVLTTSPGAISPLRPASSTRAAILARRRAAATRSRRCPASSGLAVLAVGRLGLDEVGCPPPDQLLRRE